MRHLRLSHLLHLIGLVLAGALAALALPAGPAAAQSPSLVSRPVKLVIPGPPAGPAGAMANILSTSLATHLGQNVIVEYKPGAGGNIAIDAVARSPADGYTLFFAVPALVTNPFFMKQSHDPALLVPVIQINTGPFLLLVGAKSGIRSLDDLIARIKAQPGKVSCATTGVALSMVSCHLLQAHAGPMLLVSYVGNAQAAGAVEHGEVQVLFDFVNTAGGAVKAGRLRALAVTSAARTTSDFTELAPIGATIPGFELVGWQGIMVPAATPRDIVERLHAAFSKVLGEAQVRDLIRANNLEVAGGSPEAFGARIKRDYEFYGRIARDAGIEPQ